MKIQHFNFQVNTWWHFGAACINHKNKLKWKITNRETGYRVTAVPVERKEMYNGIIESFTAFTGFGDTLLPCSRRSNKRYEQAIKKFKENMPKYITWFEDKGYIISEEFKKDIVKFSNF